MKNTNIIEKKVDTFMNLLYDDFIFEEIFSLKKELENELKTYKLEINSEHKDEDDFDYDEFNTEVRIKEIESDLKSIYQNRKEIIDYLIENGKKLLNKEDYNNLSWLKDFFYKN